MMGESTNEFQIFCIHRLGKCVMFVIMISYRLSVTSTGPVGKNMDMSVILSLVISESITFGNRGMNTSPLDHWN